MYYLYEGVEHHQYKVLKCHTPVHMSNPEHVCVMHTHTTAGTAIACQKEGLLPINQHALAAIYTTGYHDYEGPATDHGERERIVQDLGDRRQAVGGTRWRYWWLAPGRFLRPRIPVIDVYIGPADPGPVNLDQHIVDPDLRFRNVLERQPLFRLSFD